MTTHQKRVNKVKYALLDRSQSISTPDAERLARYVLRMGGRAPGETCDNCRSKAVVTCVFCSRHHTDNWRPKGGAR
jgi:hypothetical protein